MNGTKLMEKSNQLQQTKKDLEYYKSAHESYDQNYKAEKVKIVCQTMSYLILHSTGAIASILKVEHSLQIDRLIVVPLF